MNSAVFGQQTAAMILDRHPPLSRILGRMTLLFECVGPLLVFLGPIPCLTFIACGVLFHLSNAVLLGLNKFVWTFTATYPALLVISLDLHLTGIPRGLRLGLPRLNGWVHTERPVTVAGLLVFLIVLVQWWLLVHVAHQNRRLRVRIEYLDALVAQGGGHVSYVDTLPRGHSTPRGRFPPYL